MNRFILLIAAVGIALLSLGLQPVRPVAAADPLLPSAAFPFPYPLDRLPAPNRLEQSLKGFPLIAPPIVPLLTDGAEAPLELQQNTTVQAVTPESLPDIEFAPVPETPSTATVAEGTITQFLGVSIEGSTVYSDAELQSIVAPLIGKRAEVGKLYEAARIITDKYRKDGYFLSQALVPDQTISDGYYRIRVIEGYVSDVLIQGDVGFVESLVRRYLAKIPGNVPIKLSTVERYLLLARDIPGLSITSIFRSATGASGARQMVVNLERKSFGGMISADNRASEYAGTGELLTRFYSSSFTSFGEQADFLYQNSWDAKNFNFTGNQNQLDLQHFAYLSLSGYLGGDGLKLTLSGNYNPSRPGRELRGYYSKSHALSASLNYPIVRSRDFNLATSVSLSINNSSTEQQNIFTDEYSPSSRSRLRSFNWTIQGDIVDPAGYNNLSLSFEKGLPILGSTPVHATPSLDFVDRPGGHSDYRKFSFEASSTHLLHQFSWGEISHYAYFSGQYSLDRLYGSEQFSAGGTKCGRGYFAGRLGQIVPADLGLCTMQEVQFAVITDIGLDSGALKPVYYVFVDSAKGWERKFAEGDGTPAALRKAAVLSSMGFGVRTVFPGTGLQFDLDFDLPLTYSPYGPEPFPPAYDHEFVNKTWGTFFRLSWSY